MDQRQRDGSLHTMLPPKAKLFVVNTEHGLIAQRSAERTGAALYCARPVGPRRVVHAHLRANYRCVCDNARIMAFDLTRPPD